MGSNEVLFSGVSVTLKCTGIDTGIVILLNDNQPCKMDKRLKVR